MASLTAFSKAEVKDSEMAAKMGCMKDYLKVDVTAFLMVC